MEVLDGCVFNAHCHFCPYIHLSQPTHCWYTVSVLNFVGKIFRGSLNLLICACIKFCGYNFRGSLHKFVAKAYQYLIFLLSCSEVMANDVRIHSASARH